MIRADIARTHQGGDIHIHDLDFYGKTLTCVQIPLGRLLAEGFNTGHGYVRPPKRPASAAALAAIIIQSCQNDMHGGQSFPFFDTDMAPYMEGRSEDEVYQAMEALVFNLNSMHSRAGAQVPFSSLNLGCDTSKGGRLASKCLLEAYEAGLGRGETPVFPNIIFRVKAGVNANPGDPNYDLFLLACRVAARQLLNRYDVQSRLRVRDMPFLMGQHVYMGSEGLSADDEIAPAIKHGTLSIGFIGLAETLNTLCGGNRTQSIEVGPDGGVGSGVAAASDDADALGYEIVRFMRRRVDEYAEAHDLNFTLLATPAEGLSGRFVAIDREWFGTVPGVTDCAYYTNSFHVPVGTRVSIWDKLAREGKYHNLANAGHISYVELSSPPLHNVEAVESIVRAMARADLGYGGINFPIDECLSCGYSGVIESVCPACQSGSIRRVRRITGYLSTVDRFNDAKRAELADRAAHTRDAESSRTGVHKRGAERR